MYLNSAKGLHCCFSAATMLTRKRQNVTLYIHCLSSPGSRLQVLPYKAINQAKCFVYHNIFKLVQLFWINLVVKGINCYMHLQTRQFSSMAFSKVKWFLNFILAFWIRHTFLNHGNTKAVLSWYMWHFLLYTFLETCYNATVSLFHSRHKTKVTLTKIQ